MRGSYDPKAGKKYGGNRGAVEVSAEHSNISINMTEKTKDKDQVKPVGKLFTDVEKRNVISSLKNEIRSEVFGWLNRWKLIIVGGLSVCSIIGFIIMCWQVYAWVRRESAIYITDSITKKFAEPNIQNTLQEVASQEARTIIQSEVQPEAEEAKRQTAVFENYLNQMEVKFDAEYKNLADQVSRLAERDRLIQLADDAINNGNRQAYEELLRMANNASVDEKVRSAAKAEWFQVKRFYIGLTRVKSRNLARLQPDGTKIDLKNEELTTQELIQSMLGHNNWIVRALATSSLKDRKEGGVPGALLHAAHNDQNLDVVKEAIDSFESVTGYKGADVFGVEAAEVWWQTNEVEVEQKLKEQSQKSENPKSEEGK